MSIEEFPMFNENRMIAANAILEILDEVSMPLPSDSGENNPNKEADLHVLRLQNLVNLYGGAKTAIAIRLLKLFEGGWIALSSIAKENQAKNDEEAMRMVMDAVGLTGEMSHFQLAQLKTFLVRTLPELKRAASLTEEEQIEFVLGCIKENGDGLSARIERNIRNANTLTAKNPTLTAEQADVVVQALRSGEISRELESMIENKPVTPGAGAPKKIECRMMTVSPDGTTEFSIRVPLDMMELTERLLAKYFDIKPY